MSLERINLAVTKYCNLRCRMCDYPSGKFWTNALSKEQIKDLIREAAELGVKTVELSGGEPMMRKDIYEIISFAASLNLKVFMASNGVLIGPEEVKKLLDAGLTLVTFSLEGPEELNDSIRGAGNFKKTMQAIKSFLGYREQIPELEVMVGIVLSKYNYKMIADFSEYLLKDVGINSISINPFNASMLSEKNRKLREAEFKITSDMMPDLKNEIQKLVDLSNENPDRMPAAAYLDRIPDYFSGKNLFLKTGVIYLKVFAEYLRREWYLPVGTANL